MQIRNFSIIAHIDHGKSTLSDRLLMRAGAITEREFKEQILDDMDLERERGITIKASAVTVFHEHKGEKYMLNFIDTPGHVDFHYEVQKSLQACEGAILVVDSTQGVQAQTVANAYAAVDVGLEIIAVINKIDLPSARPEVVADEVEQVLGFPAEDAIPVSAKTGQGIDDLIVALCEKLPGPRGDPNGKTRALIFDSIYDDYRGVITYVRVVDGELHKGQKIRFMGTNKLYQITDLGKLIPRPARVEKIGHGEVGFVVAAIKDLHDVRVGDTITDDANPATEQLAGYKPVLQMVYCDFYPSGDTQYDELRDAMDRLSINDASFSFEPENNDALGFGFRCGFLGLLHMEIIQERLEREFNIEVIQTAPTVTYEVLTTDGTTKKIDSPSELPDPTYVTEIREPFINMQMILPQDCVGAMMNICEDRRGIYTKTEYLGNTGRVILSYELPLAEVIYDFYDRLKSATKGYGTMDYDVIGFRVGNLVKVDILVNGDRVDALSVVVHRDHAEARSRKLLLRLKEEIDRHLFEIPLQAAIGGKVIARETIKSVGKNVTAKCYGGDVSRKRKLLEKQKEGKKRMKRMGSVDIPQQAFLAILESSDLVATIDAELDMTTISKPMTADDLWNRPDDHQRHELVHGELRTMAPAGFGHGSIGMKIGSLLLRHVDSHKLGVVVGADTGFILRRNPDTVRAPDAAFVKASRLPSPELPKKFFDGAPDVAVEVLSPSGTVEVVDEKTMDYLETGCSQVWVVNPERKTITIHAIDSNPIVLRESDSLTGGDVVPGFSCKVSDLF